MTNNCNELRTSDGNKPAIAQLTVGRSGVYATLQPDRVGDRAVFWYHRIPEGTAWAWLRWAGTLNGDDRVFGGHDVFPWYVRRHGKASLRLEAPPLRRLTANPATGFGGYFTAGGGDKVYVGEPKAREGGDGCAVSCWESGAATTLSKRPKVSGFTNVPFRDGPLRLLAEFPGEGIRVLRGRLMLPQSWSYQVYASEDANNVSDTILLRHSRPRDLLGDRVYLTRWAITRTHDGFVFELCAVRRIEDISSNTILLPTSQGCYGVYRCKSSQTSAYTHTEILDYEQGIDPQLIDHFEEPLDGGAKRPPITAVSPCGSLLIACGCEVYLYVRNMGELYRPAYRVVRMAFPHPVRAVSFIPGISMRQSQAKVLVAYRNIVETVEVGGLLRVKDKQQGLSHGRLVLPETESKPTRRLTY